MWPSVRAPRGIEGGLFAAFVLLGVIGAALAARERNRASFAAVVAHAMAGLLAVVANDMVTLLTAWEIMSVSAFFIIRTSPKAGAAARSGPARAAFWYLAAQICSAVLFFVSMVVHAGATGSVAIAPLRPEAQPAMAAAVLIKTAMMPLHGWLILAYSSAGPTAAAFLSVYTTKVGILTAARMLHFYPWSFPVLSAVGAVVAVVAVVFALLQVSVRRLLSYHLISQVGYMLVGVGLAGSPETGAPAVTAGLFHAINNIFYKSLLFLTAAAVIERTGREDLRELGGLRSSMPTVFCCALVGALSISGVPFTSGYASKELLKAAVGYGPLYFLMVAAAAGTGLSFTKFITMIFLGPARDSLAAAREERASPGRKDPILVGAMVVLALGSLAFGVAPRLVPGVPAHQFFTPTAIASGAGPLLASAALWLLLRRRLAAGSTHKRRRVPLHRRLPVAARSLLSIVRNSHAANPQVYFGAVLFAALALAAFLIYRV